MRSLFRVLLPLFLVTSMHAQRPTTLLALRDYTRPLLLFGGANDMRTQQQLAELAKHAKELRERDIRVIVIDTVPHHDAELDALPTATLAPPEEAYARQQFHVGLNEFAVVLVGKDGGEKLRSQQPFSWPQLAETIDVMPMRQQEMRRR